MKVVCFINNLCSGGGQRQLVNLGISLKHSGHDVSFLTYHKNDFYLHYLNEAGIKEIQLKCKNNFDRIVKVRSYLNRSGADVVISFLETPNFLACISAIGHHSWKLITNELSAKPESFTSKKGKFFKWFERFSDWTVCNSRNAMNMWVGFYPMYKERLSTIYNPIDIPEDVIQKAEAYKGSQVRRLVVAASYQYLKNPIGLIEALNLLSKDDQALIHVDWFGRQEINPGYKEPYEVAVALLKQYQLENVITLHDETKCIYDEMANADAVGLFSTVEGLPNVICEGMMMGKPVIMTRISDYQVMFSDNNGFLCDAKEYSSIASALKEFIYTPLDILTEMGKRSRKLALELFAPSVILQQWESLIEGLKADS